MPVGVVIPQRFIRQGGDVAVTVIDQVHRRATCPTGANRSYGAEQCGQQHIGVGRGSRDGVRGEAVRIVVAVPHRDRCG